MQNYGCVAGGYQKEWDTRADALIVVNLCAAERNGWVRGFTESGTWPHMRGGSMNKLLTRV